LFFRFPAFWWWRRRRRLFRASFKWREKGREKIRKIVSLLQRRRHRVLLSPSPGQTFQHGDDRHGRDVRAAQLDDGVGDFRGEVHAGETRQSTQAFVDFVMLQHHRFLGRRLRTREEKK